MFIYTATAKSTLYKNMEVKTNRGESFEQLAEDRKLMLVFLRHFGCTFCRETMQELAEKKYQIEAKGLELVIVHMVSSDVANEIFKVYDLEGVRHIADPHQFLYRKFGLGKATFKSFFGVRNWYRAFVAGIVKGHLIGKPAGDPFQMPGAFVFHKNEILNKFDYDYVSDIPDFNDMADVAQIAR